MQEKYYCPTCKKEVETIDACGASNYFCNHCKKLVSSKTILKEADLVQNQEDKDEA